jgi:hypothetical protein
VSPQPRVIERHCPGSTFIASLMLTQHSITTALCWLAYFFLSYCRSILQRSRIYIYLGWMALSSNKHSLFACALSLLALLFTRDFSASQHVPTKLDLSRWISLACRICKSDCSVFCQPQLLVQLVRAVFLTRFQVGV